MERKRKKRETNFPKDPSMERKQTSLSLRKRKQKKALRSPKLKKSRRTKPKGTRKPLQRNLRGWMKQRRPKKESLVKNLTRT